MVARFRCVSVAVSPCPGKCFAVTSTRDPATECAPSMNADTNSRHRPGSSPYERILMIGLSGLLLTSASGKKSHWTPRARASCRDLALDAGFVRIARRGECHGMRENGGGVDAHGSAALKIARNDQRHFREPLHSVDEAGHFKWIGFGSHAAIETLIRISPPTCSCVTRWTNLR